MKPCTALERLPDAATRVFNFSSALLPNGTLDPSKADNNTMGVPISNYGLSKYVLVFHAAEFAERERANGVTAFSLHPGVIDTDMVKQIGDPSIVAKWCMGQNPCPRNPEQGASTQTYLAAAPLGDISKDNGKFFSSCSSSKSVKTIYSLTHSKNAVEKYQAGIYDMCVDMTRSGMTSV